MPAGSNAYNSLWQVRTDAWSALEESTAQLALAGAQQRPVEQLTDAVAGALDVLAPIERFWAFPGMQAFYRVRRLFATGKYDRCASMVARINRTLATDSHRGGHTWDADADDEAYEHEVRPADQSRQDRPYFEVLVVEDMTEDQERALREELRRWRRPDDQVVSTTYVTPYPPGFPVLVPGQVFSRQILAFMRSLDTPEVHGYRTDLGYRVYVDKALEIAATTRPAPPPDLAGPAPASAAADAIPSTSRSAR